MSVLAPMLAPTGVLALKQAFPAVFFYPAFSVTGLGFLVVEAAPREAFGSESVHLLFDQAMVLASVF